jgi:hypothetical protein
MRTRAFLALAALICTFTQAADALDLPPIGIIDFHGLRAHSEAEVRKLLPFREGDDIPPVPAKAIGDAVAGALHVPQVGLSYVCCTPDQKTIVFVGIAETAPSSWQEAPEGPARLPESMIRAYEQFMGVIFELIKSGSHAPADHSQGHYLDPRPPLRAIQEGFVAFARNEAGLVQQVLAESADPAHRSVAAMLAGYMPDKAAAATVLSRAALDPDSGVRNNATRALAIIAEYAHEHPDLGIRIEVAPFIDMLNSHTWTDLNKGIFLLDKLASRDPALLAELRRKARPALIDICRWKSGGHAEPGCAVLRRVEGLPDRPGPEGRDEILRQVDGT